MMADGATRPECPVLFASGAPEEIRTASLIRVRARERGIQQLSDLWIPGLRASRAPE
jgi:hypothetical protein